MTYKWETMVFKFTCFDAPKRNPSNVFTDAPWKVFLTLSYPPGALIFGLSFSNVASACIEKKLRLKQFCKEASRWMHNSITCSTKVGTLGSVSAKPSHCAISLLFHKCWKDFCTDPDRNIFFSSSSSSSRKKKEKNRISIKIHIRTWAMKVSNSIHHLSTLLPSYYTFYIASDGRDCEWVSKWVSQRNRNTEKWQTERVSERARQRHTHIQWKRETDSQTQKVRQGQIQRQTHTVRRDRIQRESEDSKDGDRYGQ